MTSNIGTSEFTKEASNLGFATANKKPDQTKSSMEKKYEWLKNKTLNELKTYMRPELINRIDQISVFNPLNIEAIEKILNLEIKSLEDRLKDRGVKINVENDAKRILAKKSFNPNEGARLARRQVQRLIEDQIAELILGSDKPFEKTVVVIKNKNGEIIVEPKNN